MLFSFLLNIFLNNVMFDNMAAKGDMLNVHCVRPCFDTYDDESCYNDCVRENNRAGFYYPKLPNISSEKDCCCNI